MARWNKNLRTISKPDGGVILDLRQGRIFHLNPSGAAIIDFIVRHNDCTEQQIAAELIGRFGVDRLAALADVQAFLGSLSDNGLLGKEVD